MLGLIPLVIGIFLGLLGGGGSVLAVPALVYFYGLETKSAIATSLLIVGLSSLVMSVKPLVRRELDLKAIFSFSIFAILGAFVSAKYFSIYLSGELQLALFALLTFAIGFLMLRKTPSPIDSTDGLPAFLEFLESKTWLLAFVVGVITGLVGVGGGFLLVPSLHYLLKLPMQLAIKSSLLIITLQSLSAFAGYTSSMVLDYSLLGQFMMFMLVGNSIGLFLRARFNEILLRKSFAYLLIFLGIFILLKTVL